MSNVTRFARFGRTYQLLIKNVNDLKQAVVLDEALWVATAAPISSLIDCDKTFLALLDGDSDGRILAEDVRAAIRWLSDIFRDTTGIDAQSSTLVLEHLNTQHDDGKKIFDAARVALTRLQATDLSKIELAQVRASLEVRKQFPVGENGVILPAATDAEDLKAFLNDVILVTGGAEHPSGARGVDAASLDKFLSAAKTWLDWEARGLLPDGKPTEVKPLGDATAGAFDALAAVRSKLTQYFSQCKVVSFEPATADKFMSRYAELKTPDLADPAKIQALLEESPLAAPRADGTLDFGGRLNPAYSAKLIAFRDTVVQPLLGRAVTSLSEADLAAVAAKLAPYESWIASKAGTEASVIASDKLKAHLDPALADRTRAIIGTSKEVAQANDLLRLVEKAALFQAGMIRFCNNFIAMPELFDTKTSAMFEMGTLVMDGRRFNLSMKVENRAEHSAVAGGGGTFIIYVNAVLKNKLETMELAIPVTAGLRGNLVVGKRGIFIDMQGREWNAQIVQILENPISLKEAIVAPFNRIGQMIKGKIETMQGNANKNLENAGASAISTVEGAATNPKPVTPPPPPPPPAPAPAAGGGLPVALAGGGIALAALGSAAAFISQTIASLRYWQVCSLVLSAVAAVLVPTLILAWLKLRKRDLSAMLEGASWAINPRLRMTGKLAAELTQTPKYPEPSVGAPAPSKLVRVLLWALAITVVTWFAYTIYLDYDAAQVEKEAQRLEAQAAREAKKKADKLAAATTQPGPTTAPAK